MFDVALNQAGAQVVLATSCDESFPPENIIDGNSETFWVTTGRFPQEFIVTFQNLMKIENINIQCCNVKQLMVETSVHNDAVDFELLGCVRDLEATDGQLQNEDMEASNIHALHMRFTIISAYHHFCSVHKVYVNGTALHG